MPLPPTSLVEWTKYVALLVTTFSGVRALWKGAGFMDLKIRQLYLAEPRLKEKP